jgi:hypothetical protein
VERAERFEIELDFDTWFARTRTPAPDAARARELLAPRTSPDGAAWRSPMLVLQARRSQG